jgi:LmbE family N-acetylglucosaminyl deacetylase
MPALHRRTSAAHISFMARIVVISAHPDDMEIGMGGTVAKLTQAGNDVTSIILTDGGGSANPFSLTRSQMVELRKQEAQSAAKQLGVNQTLFLEVADLKDTAQYEAAKRKLQKYFESSKPDEIYTLHPDLDRHPTHQLAGRITVESTPRVTVWAYEVWGLFSKWDRLEDISNEMGQKLRAIHEHKSQIAALPFAEAVAGLNRWRAVFADPQAKQIETLYAEVFVRLC